MFRYFGWLLLASAISVSATTYEVAQRNPQASDNGAGTREHPWKTIAKAAQQVAAGDKVIIRDGIYREHIAVKKNGTALAYFIRGGSQRACSHHWC